MKLKPDSGITLIPVITAIVALVIITAATLNIMNGDSSILKRAEKGVDEYQKTIDMEELEEKAYKLFLKKRGKDYSLEEYTAYLVKNKVTSNSNISIDDENDQMAIIEMKSRYKYEVSIDDDGEIKCEFIGIGN